MAKIRNFCIIAHIDHGKSTLADRMLELTGTIDKREMKEQVLDRMDIERERGITIKLQPVTMHWQGYTLNLIDTPGHVDFAYEVSRSLAAVEGAILLVDASQGIQAQTLANLYLALEQNLTIIPVVNKIDLPAADKQKTAAEIVKLLGLAKEEIIYASAKTGLGVKEILDAVIRRLPAPPQDYTAPPRALIFDSNYDDYRGVVAYIRVVDGQFKAKEKITLMASGANSEVLAVGTFAPDYRPAAKLTAGQIGYLITGFKQVGDCRVGDTICLSAQKGKTQPLKGYNEAKPMVFAGLFPAQAQDYENLRQAIEKLKLNDAALTYAPERSSALGFGFRCGFLGLLHLEIITERLRREFGLEVIATAPSVAYQVYKTNKEKIIVRSPYDLPEPSEIERIEEPWVKLEIITPKEYLGAIMSLLSERRGQYQNTEYLTGGRAILRYQAPLTAILTDFYDKIKSLSAGFASLNYELSGWRPAKLVKLEILVAEEPVEALAMIVYADEAYRRGREIVKALKETLPRQMFVLKIQAAVGGKIIAAERLPALRKDVTAKLYGGDVTRKRKLLEKQKKGKKKMLAAAKGKVTVPASAFIKILKQQ